jgi:G:T-mismatch repair DNA endonuclease (very short patch repair protein)
MPIKGHPLSGEARAKLRASHTARKAQRPARYCLHCGKDITGTEKRRSYCSRTCHFESRKVFKVCGHCGKSYRKTEGGGDVNCSEACSQAASLSRRNKCLICQSPVKDFRHDALYCSKKCFGLATRTVDERDCDFCGISYRPPGSDPRHRFCSKTCRSKYGGKCAAMNTPEQKQVSCAQCGKTFLLAACYARTAKFCSQSCKHKSQIGPRPDQQNRLEYTCEICGKKWMDKPSLRHRKKHCSRSCHGVSVALSNQTKPTWIETETYAALDLLGIPFSPQHRIGNCVVDALITGEAIVIECQGDFWHCNPNVYPDGPKFWTQWQVVAKDARRLPYLQKLGYQVIFLWEKEILEIGAVPLLRSRLNSYMDTRPNLEQV